MSMKRCTLMFVILLVLVSAFAAQASVASAPMDYIQGKTRTIIRPDADIGITVFYPKEWAKYTSLGMKFWQQNDIIYADCIVQLDILAKYGDQKAQRFRVFVTDPGLSVPYSRETDRDRVRQRRNAKEWDPEDDFAGLRDLGEYKGRYARVQFSTTGSEPGFIYAYLAIPQRDKYHLFGEPTVAIPIAPTLPEVAVAMENANDEELSQWGLKAVTLQEVIASEKDEKAVFDLYCSDGSVFERVRPVSGSAPHTGKILAFYSDGYQYAPFVITKVEGNRVYTSATSRFMSGVDYQTLVPEWVVEAAVSGKSGIKLDTEQQRNLLTYPEELREPMRQMAQTVSPVKHLRTPFKKGDSARVWADYQLFCKQHKTYTTAPTAYVPVSRAKEVRVILLVSGGRPFVMLGNPERTEVTYKGLFSFGVILRNPDRTINQGGQGGNAEANAAAAAAAANSNYNWSYNANTNNNQ